MAMTTRRTIQASGCVFIASLSAYAEHDVVADTTRDVSTWEEFRASAARKVDGDQFYVVEWDIPIRSEERLWNYYQQTYLDAEVGSSAQPLIIHQYNGSDDVWSAQEAQVLRYCVSTSFADYPRAVDEMRKATSAWMSVIHVSSEDTNCTVANTNIVIPVQPWSIGGACAFLPHDPDEVCIDRSLVINYDDFDTHPFWRENAPNMTTVSVLRHELGHVLGFHHEWFRSPSSVNGDTSSTWRAVTDYDIASVMHYPYHEDGLSTSDMSFTPMDNVGSMSIYGMSTALTTAIF